MTISGLSAELANIVARVERGDRLDSSDALILWHEAPLALLGQLAFAAKRRKSGDEVYYNRNFHIEPTNVCIFSCRFCSYRRPEGSPEAWDYSMEEVERIAERYAGRPVTEVHIVGGVHPRHDLHYYIDMIRRVKRILPSASVKAFTAVELAYMIDHAGLTDRQGLTLLKEAGMAAIPGGGAEIFEPGLRSRICPDKCSADRWLALHEAAHGLGIPTNATILYGHIESVEHRIDHLERLRQLQDRTGGFDAFIPLKFRKEGNELSSAGEVSATEDMRMMALSRLYLDNFPHIKAYWPMYGKVITEMALAFGADDIDGTIDDTTRIYSMAGAEDEHPSLTIEEIGRMAASAGLQAVERDTFYNKL